MEKFSKQTWNSFDEFQDSLQQFCDSNFHVLRVQDCRKIPETDSLAKKFKYQYARYECVHGGKPRENKKDLSRPDQSSQALQCPFYFRIKKCGDKIVIGDTHCDRHTHDVTELLYKSHPLTKQKKIKSNSTAMELVENLIVTKADRHDAIELLQKKHDLQFSNKDLHNLKVKLLIIINFYK